MKAIVTGAGGFVGPHLSECLEAAGDTVIGLDLSNGPDLLDTQGWADVVASNEPDVIYHLAGWSDVSASWRDPVRAFEVNALGTLSVLQAAAEAEVRRVVLISSADVYGTVDPTAQPIHETHPPEPRSPYGVSKQSAEALGRQHVLAHGLGVIIVRPFNHLGPGQSPNFVAPAFASQIAEAEQQGGGRLAHGDLMAKRDLTDVRDVVRAYRLLALHGEPGETYNVCSGTAVSMDTVLAKLVALSSVPIESEVDPSRLRPVELPILEGSNKKLVDTTGWKPEFTLERTLADVLADARARVSA